MENIDKIYELLDSIEVTKENSIEIANIRQLLAKKNFYFHPLDSISSSSN